MMVLETISGPSICFKGDATFRITYERVISNNEKKKLSFLMTVKLVKTLIFLQCLKLAPLAVPFLYY